MILLGDFNTQAVEAFVTVARFCVRPVLWHD